MQHLGSDARGDLIANVHVRLPQGLGPSQRELVEELDRAGEPAARAAR
jgi:hypothetical protein